MPRAAAIPVYLEEGKSKTFAGALDWPGWSRSGRDAEAALRALLDYGPRYARAVSRARLGFTAPKEAAAFTVVETLQGNATTDFGAPALAPAADAAPMNPADLKRAEKVLRACWRALDKAIEAAEGKELQKGPRGGGRDAESILKHLLGSDAGYLGQLGWKFKPDESAPLGEQLARIREAMLDGLAASARGELPTRGPRGGLRWTARYYMRRVAWHTLDHAWEVEDRSA